MAKDLFQRSKDNVASTTKSLPSKRQNNTADDNNWFCLACGEDRVANMRQCTNCKKWYHDDCVGLTEDDLDFECPNCE